MDTRPPGVNDRVRLPGLFRLYTVRAAVGGMLTVVGPRGGDLRVVHAEDVTVVERAPTRNTDTDPREEHP